jgi:hypothetical protein
MVKTSPIVEISQSTKSCKDQGFINFFKANEDTLFFGPSQILLRMINNVLTSEKVPLAMKKSHLRQKSLQIFKETALNEVQTTVWACLIERLTFNSSKFSLWFRLLGCALFSKKLLGDSIEYLLEKFSRKDKSFLKNYEEWRKICDKVNLNVRDIIKKYSQISLGKTEKIDYNFYVDEIVFTFNPYHKESKKISVENSEDSDLDFFADFDTLPVKNNCLDLIDGENDFKVLNSLE